MAKGHLCDHDMMKKILGTKDHLKGHDKMTLDGVMKKVIFPLSSLSIYVYKEPVN